MPPLSAPRPPPPLFSSRSQKRPPESRLHLPRFHLCPRVPPPGPRSLAAALPGAQGGCGLPQVRFKMPACPSLAPPPDQHRTSDPGPPDRSSSLPPLGLTPWPSRLSSLRPAPAPPRLPCAAWFLTAGWCREPSPGPSHGPAQASPEAPWEGSFRPAEGQWARVGCPACE